MILLIGFVVGAGVTIFNIEPTIFKPKPVPSEIRYEGTITFLCGKTPMQITLTERNLDIDDDFEEAVKKVCQSDVSNVEDWTRRKYQYDKKYPDFRSFDEDKIRWNKCRQEGLNYDSKSKSCVTKDIGVIK